MVQLDSGSMSASIEIVACAYCRDCQTELAHGVQRRRASVKQLLDELWNCGASGPVF